MNISGCFGKYPLPEQAFYFNIFFLLFYMQLNTGYTAIIGIQGFKFFNKCTG